MAGPEYLPKLARLAPLIPGEAGESCQELEARKYAILRPISGTRRVPRHGVFDSSELAGIADDPLVNVSRIPKFPILAIVNFESRFRDP